MFFAASVPASVGIGMYISKRSSLKVRDRTELGRLSSEQQLLTQKYDLQQKIAHIAQELQTNHKSPPVNYPLIRQAVRGTTTAATDRSVRPP